LKEKVEGLKPPTPETEQGGSDDVGDISWVVPMVYLRYPANIPHTPGHSWADAVAMATPLAHKGSTAGAKVQALTALDLMLSPDTIRDAWTYYKDVQTKDMKYTPLIAADDRKDPDACHFLDHATVPCRTARSHRRHRAVHRRVWRIQQCKTHFDESDQLRSLAVVAVCVGVGQRLGERAD